MKSDTVDIFWDISVFLYRIKAPYDKPRIDELKREVPGQFRTWDPPTKTWVFEEDYLSAVLKIYSGYKIKLRGRQDVEREQRASLPAHIEADEITKACVKFIGFLDADAIGKAFKVQAVKMHPDKGGDAKAFAEFNEAYQYIMAGRK